MNLREMSPWRVTSWICTGALAVSLLTCIAIAATRSLGLTAVTVTALDPAKEPVDHVVPLIKRHEALPDYELTILLRNGDTIRLGTKPDTSAAGGLEWRIEEPVCVADIASLRLTEQDKVVSDALAEIQVSGESFTENGYRFDFQTERSFAVGVHSFYKTPIGMAILGGVFVAVALIVLSNL